jgi:hypothetical protein
MFNEPQSSEEWNRLLEEIEANPDLGPAERWNQVQILVGRFADRSGRNTPAACLANQERILAAMAKRATEKHA